MKKVIFFGTIIAFVLFSNFSSFSQKQSLENKTIDFINGQVISSDDGSITGNAVVADKPYDDNVIGVFVIPEYTQKPNGEPTLIPKSVIKSEGIVMVRYSAENGVIHKGDWITSSSQPGVSMKSVKSGMVLGVALEDSKESSGMIRIRVLIHYLNK